MRNSTHSLLRAVSTMAALIGLSAVSFPSMAGVSIGLGYGSHGYGSFNIGYSGHHGGYNRGHYSVGYGYGGYGHRGRHRGHHSFNFSLHSYGYPRHYSPYRRHGYGYGRGYRHGYGRGYYGPYYGRSHQPYYRGHYWPSYGHYSQPHYSQPTYTYAAPRPAPPAPVTPSYYPVSDAGWKLLQAGRSIEAMHTFGREAESNPSAAVPKAGYAIAQASSGNYAKGVMAMRRAFEVDPQSIHYVEIDKELAPKMHGLIYAYEGNSNSFLNSDYAFMTAALAFLMDDYAKARNAINAARRFGDNSASAINLERLLDQYSPTTQAKQQAAPEKTDYRI